MAKKNVNYSLFISIIAAIISVLSLIFQIYSSRRDYESKIVLDIFLKFKYSIDYYQLKSRLYKLKDYNERKDEDLEQLQINNSNIQFYISVIKKSSPSCDISSCESGFLNFKEKFNNINSDSALLEFFKNDEFVDECNKFIEKKIPKIQID